jgi:hypothetical protein
LAKQVVDARSAQRGVGGRRKLNRALPKVFKFRPPLTRGMPFQCGRHDAISGIDDDK